MVVEGDLVRCIETNQTVLSRKLLYIESRSRVMLNSEPSSKLLLTDTYISYRSFQTLQSADVGACKNMSDLSASHLSGLAQATKRNPRSPIRTSWTEVWRLPLGFDAPRVPTACTPVELILWGSRPSARDMESVAAINEQYVYYQTDCG